MNKKVMLVLVFFLLSSFAVADTDVSVSDSAESCSGFFGSIKCFLWGDPDNRAGKSWFDRGNLVGEAESYEHPDGALIGIYVDTDGDDVPDVVSNIEATGNHPITQEELAYYNQNKDKIKVYYGDLIQLKNDPNKNNYKYNPKPSAGGTAEPSEASAAELTLPTEPTPEPEPVDDGKSKAKSLIVYVDTNNDGTVDSKALGLDTENKDDNKYLPLTEAEIASFDPSTSVVITYGGESDIIDNLEGLVNEAQNKLKGSTNTPQPTSSSIPSPSPSPVVQLPEDKSYTSIAEGSTEVETESNGLKTITWKGNSGAEIKLVIDPNDPNKMYQMVIDPGTQPQIEQVSYNQDLIDALTQEGMTTTEISAALDKSVKSSPTPAVSGTTPTTTSDGEQSSNLEASSLATAEAESTPTASDSFPSELSSGEVLVAIIGDVAVYTDSEGQLIDLDGNLITNPTISGPVAKSDQYKNAKITAKAIEEKKISDKVTELDNLASWYTDSDEEDQIKDIVVLSSTDQLKKLQEKYDESHGEGAFQELIDDELDGNNLVDSNIALMKANNLLTEPPKPKSVPDEAEWDSSLGTWIVEKDDDTVTEYSIGIDGKLKVTNTNPDDVVVDVPTSSSVLVAQPVETAPAPPPTKTSEQIISEKIAELGGLASGYTNAEEEGKIKDIIVNSNSEELKKLQEKYDQTHGEGAFQELIDDELDGNNLVLSNLALMDANKEPEPKEVAAEAESDSPDTPASPAPTPEATPPPLAIADADIQHVLTFLVNNPPSDDDSAPTLSEQISTTPVAQELPTKIKEYIDSTSSKEKEQMKDELKSKGTFTTRSGSILTLDANGNLHVTKSDKEDSFVKTNKGVKVNMDDYSSSLQKQIKSYDFKESSGKIGETPYVSSAKKGSTIIYLDADGEPVGYSTNGGSTKKKYGSSLGPQAKKLKELIDLMKPAAKKEAEEKEKKAAVEAEKAAAEPAAPATPAPKPTPNTIAGRDYAQFLKVGEANKAANKAQEVAKETKTDYETTSQAFKDAGTDSVKIADVAKSLDVKTTKKKTADELSTESDEKYNSLSAADQKKIDEDFDPDEVPSDLNAYYEALGIDVDAEKELTPEELKKEIEAKLEEKEKAATEAEEEAGEKEKEANMQKGALNHDIRSIDKAEALVKQIDPAMLVDGEVPETYDNIDNLNEMAATLNIPPRMTDESGEEESLEDFQDRLNYRLNEIEWGGSAFDKIEDESYLQMKAAYGDVQQYTSLVGGVASLAQSAGKYKGISNALFPETTKKWSENTNNEFFNNWANLPSYVATAGSEALCGIDDNRRAKTPGSSSSFVRTQSGTYQFVGSLQAEKSSTKSPLLCLYDPDPEAEETWYCKNNLFCKDGNFCYEENKDKPAKGYFYKITWGVTAPYDEKSTPYVDENGKTVKFNILFTKGDEADLWAFKRKGKNPNEVIELDKGGRDGGVIVTYLPADYNEVCIKFHPQYHALDSIGGGVSQICADVIISDKGVNEYSDSTKVPSVTTNSAEVESNV